MPPSNPESPVPGRNDRHHAEECLSATDLYSALEREIMGLLDAVWKYRTEDNPDLDYWQPVEGKPLPFLGTHIRCPRWLVNVERLLETALAQWPRAGMPLETVQPRLQALHAAALALVNEAVGAEGEAWLRWVAATNRIGKALEEVRVLAVVAGRRTEPTGAQQPPDPVLAGSLGDWEFAPGRFRYQKDWYDLGGQRLALLEAFVKARHRTLTHDEIVTACSRSSDAYRPWANVSELNAVLCTLLGLRDKPIKPISGAQAYCLHPPV